jgi:hypothetical protein
MERLYLDRDEGQMSAKSANAPSYRAIRASILFLRQIAALRRVEPCRRTSAHVMARSQVSALGKQKLSGCQKRVNVGVIAQFVLLV